MVAANRALGRHRIIQLATAMAWFQCAALIAILTVLGGVLRLATTTRLFAISLGLTISLLITLLGQRRVRRGAQSALNTVHPRKRAVRAFGVSPAHKAVLLSSSLAIVLSCFGVPALVVAGFAIVPSAAAMLADTPWGTTVRSRRVGIVARLVLLIALVAAMTAALRDGHTWALLIVTWLAAVTAVTGFGAAWWVRRLARDAQHTRVAATLDSGLAGVMGPEALASAHLVAGRLSQATRLLQASKLSGSHLVDAASLRVRLASLQDNPQAINAFQELLRVAPHRPHGALGIADACLAQNQPALDASRFAADRARRSLRDHHLLALAEANAAWSLALLGDEDAAREHIREIRASIDTAPRGLRAATLHRLSYALQALNDDEAPNLLAEAAALDPDGLIGARARQDTHPGPVWP